MKKIILMLMVSLVAPGVLQAQVSDSQNGTATLTIPQIVQIAVDNLAIDFTPNAVDFAAGSMAPDKKDQSNVTFVANVPHVITIEADAATFSPTGDGRTNKPSTDLRVLGGALAGFTGLSTTALTLVSGSSATGNGSVAVSYQMLLDAALDIPDTYTLGFTYTITTN